MEKGRKIAPNPNRKGAEEKVVQITNKGLLAMVEFNVERIFKHHCTKTILQAIEIVLLFLILRKL